MTSNNLVMFDTFIPAWRDGYPHLSFFDRDIPYLRYADGKARGSEEANDGPWADLLPDKVSFERYPPVGAKKLPGIPGLRSRSAEMVRVVELNDGPVRARLARLGVSKEDWNGGFRRPEETFDARRARAAIKQLFHTIDGLELLAFWILAEPVFTNVSLGVIQHFEGLVAHLNKVNQNLRGADSLATRVNRSYGTQLLGLVVPQVAAVIKSAKAEARKGNRNRFEDPSWVAVQVDQLNAALAREVARLVDKLIEAPSEAASALAPPILVTPKMFRQARREEPKRAACRIVAAALGKGAVTADDLYNGEARFRGADAAPRSPRKKATRSRK